MLEGVETEARKAKKGLWADPQPVPPWEGRKRKWSFSIPDPFTLTPPHAPPCGLPLPLLHWASLRGSYALLELLVMSKDVLGPAS